MRNWNRWLMLGYITYSFGWFFYMQFLHKGEITNAILLMAAFTVFVVASRIVFTLEGIQYTDELRDQTLVYVVQAQATLLDDIAKHNAFVNETINNQSDLLLKTTKAAIGKNDVVNS